MSCIYFIDSENVGDSWIELLDESDSKFFVFYTGHSPRIAYPQAIQLMNAANKPEFVKCYEGSNGLDFQLVSYLGYELRADKTNEMIIVSKDTGFDAAIHFWTDRGMNIRRIPRSDSSNAHTPEVKEPVSDEKPVTGLPSAEVPEKISGADVRELYTIINCIGKGNPSNIHLALVHFYGNKNGEDIYKHLKKEKFAAPAVAWNKETKMKKFIDLILKYEKSPDASFPDSVTGFMLKNVVNDKKAMEEKLTKAYGTVGPQINKMFKPFYESLAKMKKK